jgi:hypothetical protein
MRNLLLAAVTALALQAQPASQSFTLTNGLRVVHIEEHQRPLIRIWLHLGLNAADTPPGCAGLAPLVLRVLDHSEAGGMTAKELDQALDASGIQWSQALGPDGAEWHLLARSRDQDRAMDLLANRVMRTSLDPQVLQAQALACWRDMERSQAFPDQRLRLALAPAWEQVPTQTSLGTLTLEDLQAFQARVFRPDRAVLLIHGDLSLEQVKRLVWLHFGTWSPAPAPPPGPPRKGTALPAPGDLVKVPERDAAPRVQTVIPCPPEIPPEAMALLEILIPSNPQAAPVQCRMEGHALVATLDGTGLSPAAALTLLRERMAALQAQGFTPLDLERARSAWKASRALDSLRPEAQLAAALAQVKGRRPTEERMDSLSLDALNEGLRHWLRSADAHTGILGSPEGLAAIP